MELDFIDCSCFFLLIFFIFGTVIKFFERTKNNKLSVNKKHISNSRLQEQTSRVTLESFVMGKRYKRSESENLCSKNSLDKIGIFLIFLSFIFSLGVFGGFMIKMNEKGASEHMPWEAHIGGGIQQIPMSSNVNINDINKKKNNGDSQQPPQFQYEKFQSYNKNLPVTLATPIPPQKPLAQQPHQQNNLPPLMNSQPEPPLASSNTISNNGQLHMIRNVATNLQNTALVIIVHNRKAYLERTLNSILKYHPGGSSVPILISQDGKDSGVQNVVNQFKVEFSIQFPNVIFTHVQHQQNNLRAGEDGYFLLAQHYKFALDKAFALEEVDGRISQKSIQDVIILEEDIEIAPDFFNFFASLVPLYNSDDKLLCISAWNDNGLKSHVRDPEALYRSDFFPGLGWMIKRSIWVDELSAIWPKAYWDDWLREPARRKGRHIIRPEISRTFHFGKQGTSHSQYSTYLDNIKLNDQPVDFLSKDLSYLEEEKWDTQYLNKVRKAKELSVSDIRSGRYNGAKEVRCTYTSVLGHGQSSFPHVAKQLGVMDNEKAKVPRTAYKGIVSFWKGDVKVHITPPDIGYALDH